MSGFPSHVLFAARKQHQKRFERDIMSGTRRHTRGEICTRRFVIRNRALFFSSTLSIHFCRQSLQPTVLPPLHSAITNARRDSSDSSALQRSREGSHLSFIDKFLERLSGERSRERGNSDAHSLLDEYCESSLRTG